MKEGNHVIHLAVEMGSLEIVKLLLSKGANPTIPDDNGDTPIHVAARTQNVEMLKLLTSFILKVPNKDGLTPLQIAKSNGNPEAIDILQNFQDITSDHFYSSDQTKDEKKLERKRKFETSGDDKSRKLLKHEMQDFRT